MRFHAAAVPFLAAGIGAESAHSKVVALEVRPFQPSPSRALSAVDAARSEANRACLADAELLCRPRDPFEERLRGGGGAVREALPPPPGNFFESSDSFDRNDLFLRLAATPPSAFESPRILDQIFGERLLPPHPPPKMMRMVQMPEAEQEEEKEDDGAEDFACLFKALDGMMESAMRTALEPPAAIQQRITIVFGPEDEESEAGPADVAVSVMDSMVNGLLDHAASASASASASEDEAEEAKDYEEEDQEEEEEEPQSGEEVYDLDEEATPQHGGVSPQSAKSRRSDDDDEEETARDEGLETPVQTTFVSKWDAITLAKMISRHGRDILAEDEEKDLRRGRRRLTEEDATKAEVRRRMARRLTEVVPFGHLTILPLMMSPPVVRLAEWKEDVIPRLGFSFRTDRCLWSRYHDSVVTLSGRCSDALKAVQESLCQLRREETAAPASPPAGAQGLWYRYVEFLEMQPNSFWYLWAAVLTMLMALVCIYDEEDEEDEYEECGDASNYVLIQDTDESGDEDERCASEGLAAFVGVPLPVVAMVFVFCTCDTHALQHFEWFHGNDPIYF